MMSTDADSAAQQHDDHIWLTVEGEGWAIHSITRPPDGSLIFALWRGYYPRIQGKILVTDPDYPWNRYCDRAVEYLGATQPLDAFLAKEAAR